MNGQGAVNVEVTPAQADNLVDDALQTFREYHYDATFRTYLSHQIQATDITNKWIPCDDSILTVVRALKVTQSTINLFDIRYQLKLQDFYNYSNVSMVHYEITQEKLALLDWMLNPEPTVAFERYMNQIHVNLDWEAEVNVGDWIVFEVYKIVDEIDFPRIWQDKWLKAYAVALFKRMQGTNLKKLGKINEVGGVVLNGQQIWDEANKEIERLEKSLREDYQPPARIFLG
jgi:hypothetical protein